MMNKLKYLFEDVADWCERHLEGVRGREIGMTFGAMLRAYSGLATLPDGLEGEERTATERELNGRAQKRLMELSTRFIMAYEVESKRSRFLLEPIWMRTNMTYDTGPRSQE